MKRTALLIAVLLSVGIATSLAQGKVVWKSSNFTITKGYVKANRNFYKSCSFLIESRFDDVNVEQILVNGSPAKVRSERTESGIRYIVNMPAGVNVRVGVQFDVQVTITDPNSGLVLMQTSSVLSKVIDENSEKEDDAVLAIPGGPGGPGGGGDPTVVIIKYP